MGLHFGLEFRPHDKDDLLIHVYCLCHITNLVQLFAKNLLQFIWC